MGSRSAKPEAASHPGGEGPPETVLVGVVIRPQALRGEVRIQIHSDVTDRFEPGRELLLRAAGKEPTKVKIASFRQIRGGGVIRFEGWEDRDRAETLRGARLEVSPQQIPPAPEGLYYHFELVGCRCIDADHGDLGAVTELIEDGGGLLLEVENNGRTLTIPFVEPFLDNVDVEQQEIKLRLPPGLVETCVSKS